MISQEWADRLEAMNRQVDRRLQELDVKREAVARYRTGRAATDMILWEAELQRDPDIDLRWEQLW